MTWVKLVLGALDSRDCAAAVPAQQVIKTKAHTLRVNQILDLTACLPKFDFEVLTMLAPSRHVKREAAFARASLACVEQR